MFSDIWCVYPSVYPIYISVHTLSLSLALSLSLPTWIFDFFCENKNKMLKSLLIGCVLVLSVSSTQLRKSGTFILSQYILYTDLLERRNARSERRPFRKRRERRNRETKDMQSETCFQIHVYIYPSL
ncbi:hypothetical protein OAV88_02675 [bacterium]|nr:hypothetical protein [bacterium]